MRETASIVLGSAVLLFVLVACKGGERSSASSVSASAAVSAAPTKPWIEQARVSWPEAVIDQELADASDRHVRVSIAYTSTPKPLDVAAHMQKLLAIEATDTPCALAITGDDGEIVDAAASERVYFIGHVVIEKGVAYKTLTPREVAKRVVERNELSHDSFDCAIATWLLVNSRKGFQHDWRAFVTEYSNVWDGSKKNVREAERLCETAADLDLYRGETYPDSSDAIDNGVRFPQMSGQTIKWRSYTNYETARSWFSCTVNANEAPTITWDHPRL